jgi:RNA polymerase primary sigma factor
MGLDGVLGQYQNLVPNMNSKQSKTREPEAATSPEGLPSLDEERSLAAAIKNGDAVARERLIMSHRRFARKIAYRWKGRGLDPADLISEAMVGLIRAVDQFDASRGVRFRTCAAFWIRQSLSRAVEDASHLIVLPTHLWKLIRKWKRATRALTAALGRAPTRDEIAKTIGLTRRQASTVVTAMTIGVKLASTVIGEGNLMSPLETFLGEQALFEEQEKEEEPQGPDEREVLRQRLSRLEVHERLVLALRYGLDGKRPHTFESIGAKFGISRHTVKAIQVRAEEKLRDGPNPRARRNRPADS